jgi:hypothetical protein
VGAGEQTGGLSPAAQVSIGVVIGVIALIALLVLGVLFVRRRSKQQRLMKEYAADLPMGAFALPDNKVVTNPMWGQQDMSGWGGGGGGSGGGGGWSSSSVLTKSWGADVAVGEMATEAPAPRRAAPAPPMPVRMAPPPPPVGWAVSAAPMEEGDAAPSLVPANPEEIEAFDDLLATLDTPGSAQ